MKKSVIFCLCTAFIVAFTVASLTTGCGRKAETVIEELETRPQPSPIQTFKTFNVYTDTKSPDNHYIPSGWMGDYGDIKLNDKAMENPRSGTTCIRIEYTPARSQGAGWIGMYWQNPANNWGTKKAGFDLTGARKLSFWARGEKGGEIISEFKMGGITGEFPDSDAAGIGPAMLAKEWKQYEMDLEGKDLSHIIGGFCFSASSDENPDGFVIYFDDIRYE